MRILFLLNSYDEEGPGYSLYRLCERWAPLRELTIQTISLGEGGPLADRLAQLGISTQVHTCRGFGDKDAMKRLGQQLSQRADCPDIVHSHCVWPDLAARWVHSTMGDVPLACTIYGLHAVDSMGFFSRLLTNFAERRSRSQCSAVVVGSDVLHRDLLRRGIAAEHLRRIPFGIDAVQCFPLSEVSKQRYRSLINVEEGSPILLSAGRLSKVKGHDLLLEAMPRVLREQPMTKLFLIGEGPELKALRAQAARLGIADSVRFIGQLSDTLLRLLSVADIVVHPSREELFAMVIAEAQAAGTPVIATRDGSIPEIVRDGETGFLVPQGDSAALGTAILTLLNDRERLDAMGQRAREVMMEFHELSETAAAYLELWKDLAPNASWRSTDAVPLEGIEEFKAASADTSH